MVANRSSLTKLNKLLVFLALSFMTAVASAEITMYLDRTDIHEHETFRLRVQVEELDTLKQGDGEQFIPEGVTVRSRQQYNSSIIINGQYNIQRGWDFELLAEKAGTYTIPALSIGNERSKPFTIRVLPEQDDISDTQNSKIKLRANVSDDEIYVQQQLIFTVRIYRSVVARNENLPPVQVSNALVEQLGDTSSFEVVKDDINYRVVERRYAIFPQQSGDMVIQPITYSARIPQENERRSPWQRSQLQPISLSTQKYTIKVKPKPQSAEEPWLPAKKLKLSAKWEPANQTFRAGEPASLDLVISATGVLKTQLPSLSFPDQDSLTIYRDSPQYHQRFNRFGVNSYHFEKVTVIPSKTGEVEIPEIKIPWWNVKTDKQEYAVLPAIKFNVNPSNKQILQQQQQAVVPQTDEAVTNSEGSEPTLNAGSQLLQNSKSNLWMYISLLLGALWLTTLMLWLYQKRKTSTAQALSSDRVKAIPERETDSYNLRAIQKFAASNDAHATLKGLLNWLSQQKQLPGLKNLNDVIKYCQKNDLQELANELKELQESLYANHTAEDSWQGQRLAKLLPQLTAKTQKGPESKLPGLYR